MTVEGFSLRALGWQRHDSMYLALPLCRSFLFSLLLARNGGEDRRLRRLSLPVYLLHPWSIVLVRGGAKILGLTGPLVENSLGHFAAVLRIPGAGLLSAHPSRPPRTGPGRSWTWRLCGTTRRF